MVAAAEAELESVERHELFIGEELTEPTLEQETPAVARFTTFAGPPESIVEGLRTFREDLVDWFRDATGFRGWLALLDAPGGRSIGITLWAAKEALADEVSSGASLERDRSQPGDGRCERRALRGRHARHPRRPETG